MSAIQEQESKNIFGLPVSVNAARCISLTSSFLVALSAGSNYGFSSYSPQLQEKLHLSSTQINIVGVMGNMGVYLSGPLWGRLVDRKGLKIPISLGATLVLLGYGGLAIAFDSKSGTFSSLWQLAILSLFSGLGNCAAFTAAMNAQAKSWHEERRGLCTAIVLSGFGLSAFFYSTLSHTLFPGKTGDYLKLLAIGSSASFLIGLALIRILPPDQPQGQEEESNISFSRRPSGSAILDGSSSPSFLRPAYARRRTSSEIGGRAWAYEQIAAEENAGEDSTGSDEEQLGTSTRSELQGLLSQNNGDSSQKANDTPLIDKTGRKLFKDADFLLLFAIMTIISGTGLLVINNIGTMTRTLYEFNKKLPNESNSIDIAKLKAFTIDISAFRKGDVQQLQAHQVSAISIGNALGRILIGLISDLVVNHSGKSVNRVYMFLVVCALALVSQGLAAWPGIISDLKKLLTMSAVTGLMYGTLFGLCPVLTFEWFGLRHFSQNWGIISLSPVIAGNVFNLLFGKVYDSHVPEKQHFCPDGEECFRQVFQVTAFGAILASILAVILIQRKTSVSINAVTR